MYVSRQKTTYQRNMLIGQGVAITLSLLLAVYLRLALPGNGMSRGTEQLKVIFNAEQKLGRSPESFTGVDRPGGTGAVSLHLPFGRNPRVVTGSLQPLSYELDELIYGHPDGDLEAGLWSIPGEDEGYIQTEGGEFVSQFETPPKLLTRDVGLIEARRPEYPFIAMDKGLEGEVELLLYIDSLGRPVPFPVRPESGEPALVDHLVISEQPADWFFARNSLRAVKDWVFAPAVENGKVVPSFLRVHISFNLSESSDWLILESR